MKRIQIGIVIFALTSFLTYISAQSFPEEWLGEWEGEMVIWRISQDQSDTIKVDLKISEINDSCWTYVMGYTSPSRPRIVKDYRIVKPDSLPVGHFLMDEQDGIYLDLVLMGGTFYNIFKVNNSLLSYRLSHMGDHLVMEIFTTLTEDVRKIEYEAEGQDPLLIESWAPFTTQKAVFYRP